MPPSGHLMPPSPSRRSRSTLRATWYKFLLRFGWRHKHGRFGLGCARYLGEHGWGGHRTEIWTCDLHKRRVL